MDGGPDAAETSPAAGSTDGPAAGDASPIDPAGTDRGLLLRRMVAGAAFAAPVVSSFSLDGMGVSPATAGAGTPSASPWVFEGLHRRDPGGFAAFASHGGRIYQVTGNHGSFLAAGALGIRFSCRVLAGSVSCRITIGTVLDTTLAIPTGTFERDLMFAEPTTEPLSVTVAFTRTALLPTTFDDVSVQGWYE